MLELLFGDPDSAVMLAGGFGSLFGALGSLLSGITGLFGKDAPEAQTQTISSADVAKAAPPPAAAVASTVGKADTTKGTKEDDLLSSLMKGNEVSSLKISRDAGIGGGDGVGLG